MRSPDEIYKSLKACATDKDCRNCGYIDMDGGCLDNIMKDALTCIRQLEDRVEELEVKPVKPDGGLPNGWIEIHGDYGRAMVVDAAKVVSVEEGYPIDRRIVRFAGTFAYSSESVEEIMQKIREATS